MLVLIVNENTLETGLDEATSYYNPTQVSFDTFMDVKVESVATSSFTSYVKLEAS